MKFLCSITCIVIVTITAEKDEIAADDVDVEETRFSINPLCEVCELAIKEIYKEIEKDKSEQKIKDAVHHVCHVIPKDHQQKCDDFVNKHGDQIIELILKAASPKIICHLVRACL